jgi:hypothetical protein
MKIKLASAKFPALLQMILEELRGLRADLKEYEANRG